METTNPVKVQYAPELAGTLGYTKLLYADEVAEMLRRTPAAFRYMVHAGTAPPSAKIAGRRVWSAATVEAYIQSAFDEEETA